MHLGSNHSQSDANYNQDEIRKIDSSASSYIAARDAFFGVDKKVEILIIYSIECILYFFHHEAN